MGCAMSSMAERLSVRRSENKNKVESPVISGKKGAPTSPGGHGRSAGDSADAIRSAFLSGQLKPDARCPLDQRQLYCISKTWKAINRNMSVTAINMFVRLFETNKDIQQMFNNLKDVSSVAELRNSKVLEGHALKVFCTVDDAIVNFDDMDYVIRMLQVVAQFHAQRLTSFEESFFWRIEEPFILAVKEELGDRFTLTTETTYRATIRFIIGNLAKEFVAVRQVASDENAPQSNRPEDAPAARQTSNGM